MGTVPVGEEEAQRGGKRSRECMAQVMSIYEQPLRIIELRLQKTLEDGL